MGEKQISYYDFQAKKNTKKIPIRIGNERNNPNNCASKKRKKSPTAPDLKLHRAKPTF